MATTRREKGKAGLKPRLPEFVHDQIERVATRFQRKMEAKFIAGQLEHGGDLSKKGTIEWLLDSMEEEAIDQYVYVQIMRERLVGIDAKDLGGAEKPDDVEMRRG